MEPLKHIYSKSFYNTFTDTLQEVLPGFNKTRFISDIYNDSWDTLELKQRMRHTTSTLHNYLSNNYKYDIETILQCIALLRNKNGVSDYDALAYMFIPDYIEIYGIEDYYTSIKAIEIVTPFTSCEFAIRPFIIKYETKAMKQMLAWSKHTNLHVRRLASEGSRPRLPWAMALPALKKDPALILPILENLKQDTSEYVRRSVANNLNDIAKDNPETVVHIAKTWYGKTADTDKLVKHASRTLLKQGHQELMQLFGFGSVENIKIKDFKIVTPKVKIGDSLAFEFNLQNTDNAASKIRLEYAVYYQKANGSLAPKVFKISEKLYEGRSTTNIHRKQSFKIITTRKFHTGLHQVGLIINGKEFNKLDFELVE